jgi:hypothetical protein
MHGIPWSCGRNNGAAEAEFGRKAQLHGSLGYGMPGLQTIIPDIPERRHPNMPDRHPALQGVVSRAMENIRDPNRGHRSGCFQRRKSRRVVHDFLRKKNLLAPTRLKVTRRGVIHPPHDRNAREQKNICAIPKAVHRSSKRLWRLWINLLNARCRYGWGLRLTHG